MQEEEDRLAALEQQIAALTTRVTGLEERFSHALPMASVSTPIVEMKTMLPQRRDLPEREGTRQGVLSYDGLAQFAGKRYRLQRQQPVRPLFDAAPEPLAQIFAALSSPHRIIILRTLCEGPRTSQQLQELLGMSSSGQLYHHLKELLAADLIVQRERSAYTIEPAKVIPICMALAVASHLRGFDRGEASGLTPPNRGASADPASPKSEHQREEQESP